MWPRNPCLIWPRLPPQLLFSLLLSPHSLPLQGKTIHGLGEYSASQAVGYFSRGILGKRKFYSVRRGSMETGHDWLGGWEFPFKARNAYFLRETWVRGLWRVYVRFPGQAFPVSAGWHGCTSWCGPGHWGGLHFVVPNYEFTLLGVKTITVGDYQEYRNKLSQLLEQLGRWEFIIHEQSKEVSDWKLLRGDIKVVGVVHAQLT